jgi:hypothetical protein
MTYSRDPFFNLNALAAVERRDANEGRRRWQEERTELTILALPDTRSKWERKEKSWKYQKRRGYRLSSYAIRTRGKIQTVGTDTSMPGSAPFDVTANGRQPTTK